MANLRLNDVTPRGAVHTIYPAAKEFGVSGHIMESILSSIYNQLGALDGASLDQKKVIAENPEYPETLQVGNWFFNDSTVKQALEEGLISKVDGNYVLTEKAKKVFQRASEIKKQLWG